MDDQIKSWLQGLPERQGFARYEIKRTGVTGKNEGYIGDIVFVTVTGFTKDKRDKRLDLVIKVSKDNQYLRENFIIVTAFKQEIHFYDKVLPEFERFQNEKGVKQVFQSYPKYYMWLELPQREIIVLQNMKMLGYELHDRQKTMNFEHTKAVLKEYGRLHAISFALRDQRKATYDSLAGKCKDLFLEFLRLPKSEDTFNHEFKKVLDILKEFGEDDLYNKFVKYQTTGAKKFMDICEVVEPQSCFAHGDCWNNNFMFKYKDGKSSPSAVCILDWQASVIRTPVYDLSYYLYSSCSHVLNRFDELMRIYHDSFSDFIRQLGSSPEIFTFEDLKRHWRQYSLLGVLFMPFLLKFVLAEENDAPDFNDMQDGQNISDFMDIELSENAKKQYYDRVKAAFLHQIETCAV
ncbi:unnamed protein product [Callosobruchus maculatus]|uniref:CHK kinase-like domain-containing protein n=1 Tax=Callosobruchus maculatus TaxID=64391 RepID=A0A653BGE5_CALMS|nr:unnamed protein product [Callosobruchus maculatus]